MALRRPAAFFCGGGAVARKPLKLERRKTPRKRLTIDGRMAFSSPRSVFAPGGAVDRKRLTFDAVTIHRKRLTIDREGPSWPTAENLLVFARQLRGRCAVLLRGAPGFADLHHQPRLLRREFSPAGFTTAPPDLGKVLPDLAVQGDSFRAHASYRKQLTM